ncbi:hypothetical protein HPP92_028198 [Vanilla planifolia]|uniref:Uncharacterized protein n=1 Tax=Vanilla planifolia TaxID=51239 RepID=A0A835U690_VANPL|nr:hypothetical protein HPP92_028198 [Vanilla planifolia]
MSDSVSKSDISCGGLQPSVINPSSTFDLSSMDLPYDGHKYIIELMNQYDSNVNGNKAFSQAGLANELQNTSSILSPAQKQTTSMAQLELVATSLKKSSSQFCPFGEDIAPMEQEILAQSHELVHEFTYSPPFNMPPMVYPDSISRGMGRSSQNHNGTDWFY